MEWTSLICVTHPSIAVKSYMFHLHLFVLLCLYVLLCTTNQAIDVIGLHQAGTNHVPACSGSFPQLRLVVVVLRLVGMQME